MAPDGQWCSYPDGKQLQERDRLGKEGCREEPNLGQARFEIFNRYPSREAK